MVYNFNLGIGWASSGVEYAQAYRANLFRKAGIPARFIFTDMFPRENIQHMTENIGFLDSEIMWLYTFFTDTKISPVTYTLGEFEKTFEKKNYEFSRDGKICKYIFPGNGNFYTVYMVDESIDRTTGVGQAIMQNAGPARIGIIIHADHFSESNCNDDYILWNNYYEYAFSQNKHVDFYVTATDAQNQLLKEQFEKYLHVSPRIVTIPVGSLDELKYPAQPRRPYSLITASRLAGEKHVNWVVAAAAQAHEQLPQLTLDIYGKGTEEENLKDQIKRLGCTDYIHLMGQQNLTEVYQDYEAYIAGSTSEGFGLTLLEAVGGGLPIIGFDVRYGNQNFIDEGQNGYKIALDEHMDDKSKIALLAEKIVKLFTQADMEAFHEHSYEKAKGYLTEEVVDKWKNLI